MAAIQFRSAFSNRAFSGFARAGDPARSRAARGAWRKPPPTWSIKSSRGCRCANGCSRFRSHCASSSAPILLSWNKDRLRFAHGLGFEVQHVPDDVSVMRVVKRLQAGCTESARRRALELTRARRSFMRVLQRLGCARPPCRCDRPRTSARRVGGVLARPRAAESSSTRCRWRRMAAASQDTPPHPLPCAAQ